VSGWCTVSVAWWRDYSELVFLAVAVVFVAFLLGWCAADDSWRDRQASCPTEDACYADYEDGRWTIIEGERP